MAGSYCNYCDQRCFVYRELIVGGETVWAGHMATCAQGRAHDRQVLGVDSTQAHNPNQAATDDASSVAAPTEATPPRVWIDQGGRAVCDRHAGNYLRSAIEHSPKAVHHLTPLGDWLADPSGEFPCETCTHP